MGGKDITSRDDNGDRMRKDCLVGLLSTGAKNSPGRSLNSGAETRRLAGLSLAADLRRSSRWQQYLAPVGDAYWVQRTTCVVPLSGTSVTIGDTAPTGDRYDLTICEIRQPLPDVTL
jgi:hypothetical protein